MRWMERQPLLCLLEIPVEVIIYAIVVELGAILDVMILGPVGEISEAEASQGRFPVVAIVIFVVATIGLFIAVLQTVIKCVQLTLKKRKKRNGSQPLH